MGKNLRYFALLYPLCLAGLCALSGFNGLYGQDAHEYLRLSRRFFAQMPDNPAFAVGYPLAGALFRLLIGNATVAMQAVCLCAAAGAVFLFERLLSLLSPGSRATSRWMYTVLTLAFSGMFLRSAVSSMSDMPALLCTLAALYAALQVMEKPDALRALLSAVAAACAVCTRFALAPLLMPLLLLTALQLMQNRKWLVLMALGAGAAAGGALFLWLHPLAPAHPLLNGWAAGNAFAMRFHTENGTLSNHLPNIVYILFPLAHPAFCLLLPGLLLLCRRTDWLLPVRRVLMACAGVYLLFLAGVPHQNLRYLLPVYAILLLLLFPAWDRFFCYGRLFFPRLSNGLIGLGIVVQLAACVWCVRPIYARNQLEQALAGALHARLPAGARLYAFDVDVALRTYCPEFQHVNLWEQRYGNFPPGSYFLFNEKLRAQWQGLNPVLNWEDALNTGALENIATLEEGWTLYVFKP